MAWGAAIGAALSAWGAYQSSKNRDNDTTTQALIHPMFREPIEDVMEAGLEAGREKEFVPFSGDQLLSLDMQRQFGRDLLPDTARLQPAGTVGAAGDFTRRTLEGDFLSPSSNPYLQENLDVLSGQITDQFNREILPQLGSAAQRAGAWGGSRQGLAEAVAADEATRNIGDVTSQFLAKNYGRERSLQQAALQMAPTVASAGVQMGLTPAQIFATTGGIERTMQQEKEGFEFGRQNELAEFLNLLNPGAGQKTAGPQPNATLAALQGGLGGWQIGKGISDVFGNNKNKTMTDYDNVFTTPTEAGG